MLTICFLLTAGTFVKTQSDIKQIKLGSNTAITIFSDEVTIKDNSVFGIGMVKGQRVQIWGQLSHGQKRLLNSNEKFIISGISGEIGKVQPATNYGENDYQKYYFSKNIAQVIKFEQAEITPVRLQSDEFIHPIRSGLKQYFASMPRLLGFFASELVLAENPSADNKDIINNYRDLGIIHLLSISGLHVSIYILALSMILYLLKIPEKTTFYFCFLLLIFFIFLSDRQAGFVRASLTYIIGQLIKFKKLKINGYDLLALTIIIHICFCPRLFMSTGAILSYTLALGLQITKKFSSFKQSLYLNLLLMPLLLFYFYQTNVLTMLFNLLAVPYFNFIVMPFSLGNILIFKFWPQLSGCLELILETFEKVVALLSKSQLGLIIFGKINSWQCLLLFILTIIFILCLNKKASYFKLKKSVLTGLVASYVISFCLIHFPLSGQVTFIDVGQGDSILITTPIFPKAYLIDTGGKLNFSKRKVTPQIEQKTIPFLKAQGITKLDGVFVSHQDADHVGDLGPLLKEIRVKRLYLGKGLLKNPAFVRRIQGLTNHTQIIELLAGDIIKENKINFEVVHPFKPGLGKNEDSLAITFVLQQKRWLFTGDLDQAGEEEIIKHYQLRVNYFKLGHHGSKTSSNPEFLKTIRPELVFISAGRHNRFGHPHKETLATLKKLAIPWVSTQDYGMISWYYGLGKPHFAYFLTEKIE